MSNAIQLIVTQAGLAEIINAEQSGTAPVVLSHVGFGTGQYTAATDRTALQAEFKRLDTIAGGYVGDNTIHITINDSSSDAYTVYEVGVYTASGTLFAVVSQNTPIIQKATGAKTLLAVDFLLTNGINPESISFGDTSFVLNPATTEQAGVVELATTEQAVAGLDNFKAVTPKGLLAKIKAFAVDYFTKTEILQKYFSKTDIRGGVQTQTIFGYDPLSNTNTNNNIYLTGDTVVVSSNGNDVVFPEKSGTIALTSDITEADKNVVHLAGAETITGTKSFATAQKFFLPNANKGELPESSQYTGFYFCDSANGITSSRLAMVELQYNKEGSVIFKLAAYKPQSGSTDIAGLSIVYPKDGSPYINGITPPAGDNSTKNATTAWVTAFGNGKFLPLVGGTVTGNLNVGKTTGSGSISVLPLGTKTAMGADAYGLHVSATGGLQLFGTHFLQGTLWDDIPSGGLMRGLKVVANNISLYSTNEAAIGFDYANKVVFRTMPNDGTEATYEFQAWQWDDDSHTTKSPSAGAKLLKPSQKSALESTSVLNMEEGDRRWLKNVVTLDETGGKLDTPSLFNLSAYSTGQLLLEASFFGSIYQYELPAKSGTIALTSDITEADKNVVHLAGSETISGVKTFSASPKVPTATAGTNDTTAANTAFVVTALGKYLPLTGGAITSANGISRNLDSSFLGLYGGSTNTGGAKLELCGKDYSQYKGEFRLYAGDGTNNIVLRGMPDGTLTWNGKSLTQQGDCLPLSGGTMTNGNVMLRDVDTSFLAIFGGKTSTTGASLSLYGGSNSSNPGEFVLYARKNSSTVKALRGKTDGTLTWDAHDVLTKGNTPYITASYNSGTTWYRKWSDGFIEQGMRVAPGDNVAYNWATPFSNTNYTITTGTEHTSNAYSVSIYSKTKSSVNIYANTSYEGCYLYACGY